MLDLANETAGYCTKILADLGARVIRVEKPQGDDARKRGPFIENSSGAKESLSFLNDNINKENITLNLFSEKGREIFRRLITKIDILVETFPPGLLVDLDLDCESLRSLNPGLIHASVTPFGDRGPRKHYKACDLVLSAYGGQMKVCGSPDGSPLKVHGNQSFYSGSLFAAIAVLLALRKRARTGMGDHLKISLQGSVTATLEHVVFRHFMEGSVPQRKGSLHWNDAFVVLPCKDGFVQASLFQKWETLIEWLEADKAAEDLADPRWLDAELRRQSIGHILDVLGRWTRKKSVQELFELGQLMRFPWAPVNAPERVLTCPQLGAREFFAWGLCAATGIPTKFPGIPFRVNGRTSRPPKAASSPGEDNERIYLQELGLSRYEFAQLQGHGVI